MEREIIVIGDIEMGAGTLTDDFISDHALSQFIFSISNKNHPVDLVLNGDTFDFMKCPLIIDNKETHPRHITKDVSVAKLNLIYKAHKKVFVALQEFVASKKNRLFFIIGNHDHDLVFPEVKEALKKLLKGHKENIFFPGFSYEENGIHVEHGHQYDFIYQAEPDRLIVTHKQKEILNLPFVTFGIITNFMDQKKKYPFFERIRPKIFLGRKHLAKKTFWRSLNYFAKSMIYYPIRYYGDPTHHSAKKNLKNFLRRFKESKRDISQMWELDSITHTYIKRKNDSLKKDTISIFGHGHEKKVVEQNGHTILQPGPWRDEYHMDHKTRQLIPKIKSHVSIEITNNGFSHQLVEHPIKRSTWDYDEVIKDEIKHIRLAAEEENYPFSLNQNL